MIPANAQIAAAPNVVDDPTQDHSSFDIGNPYSVRLVNGSSAGELHPNTAPPESAPINATEEQFV